MVGMRGRERILGLTWAMAMVSGCTDNSNSTDEVGETDSTTETGPGDSTTETGPGDSTTETGETDSTETGGPPPATPVLEMSVAPIKQFDFIWAPADGADYYQLLESADAGEPYVQVGGDLTELAISLTVPLHFRINASYKLAACNVDGCTESEVLDVAGPLVEAIGYFKASNTDSHDAFASVALSSDGSTLAVGAFAERSNAVGIDGDQANDAAFRAGAVYVFTRDGMDVWTQQAYVKASNTEISDQFGVSVALSANGDTLAVGALGEDSNAVGIDGDQADNSATNAGAAYVFERDGMNVWTQQAYIKASNAGMNDSFGASVALAGDGSTLAVGAYAEASNSAGIDGNQADNSATNAGAAYVFGRDGLNVWAQQAYIKASNANGFDYFGWSLALAGDGNTLAVSAVSEGSNAVGIDGNQSDNSADESGAVYVFGRTGMTVWTQQAYVKASNTGPGDAFGWSVALAGDGNTLAVGAYREDSNALGIDGNQADDSAADAGAVYVYERTGMTWAQQAYIKASNTDVGDYFGGSVALSSDGASLAVGAWQEDCYAAGIDGEQDNSFTIDAGSVYVYGRAGMTGWTQKAYVKASNTDKDLLLFGTSVALSADGSSLAVGAPGEGSTATGIGGDQVDDLAPEAGAVYLY